MRLSIPRLIPAALLIGLAVFALTLPAFTAEAPDALVRVAVDRPLDAIDLPVHAHLRDATGEDYVLVIAPLEEVEAAGVSFTVLDSDATGARYLLGLERRPGSRARVLKSESLPLHDDGRRVLLRVDDPAEIGAQTETLRHLGFQPSAVPPTPITLRSLSPGSFAKAATFNDEIAAMVAEARKAFVYDYNGKLSGAQPLVAGGTEHNLSTRATASGAPIDIATQFVYEHMLAQGLSTTYHPWTLGGFTGRNVVGELPGAIRPNEIVLMVAHLDSRPYSGAAPGADDNGSGSTALMLAAKIFAQRELERTVRFIFFTGEEQGLLGSQVYAQQAAAAEENIVAVLNLDMIAWNGIGDPIMRLHTRTTANPGEPADRAIAEVFVDAVNTYGLSETLMPIITPDGITASDHSPFWNWGFPAVLVIEDDADDFNPHWHRSSDRRDTLDINYFTDMVKASVATVANLAVLNGSETDRAPTRPTQLTGTALSRSSARLTWTDRSTNESAFEIHLRRDGETWSFATEASANAGNATVGGLEGGETYYYRVRARRGNLTSDWSNRATVEQPVLTRPLDLAATALSSAQVRLTWSDRSAGERNFEIHLRTPETPWAAATFVGADVTEAILPGLQAGQTYYFRVRARDRSAASPWSNRADAQLPD